MNQEHLPVAPLHITYMHVCVPAAHLCQLVADGVVIDHQGLVIDEASLTGEAEPIKKNKDEDPWIRSGTQVG